MGSLLNKRLLGRGWTPASLIRLAAVLASGSGWLVWASQASLWFLLPMTGVVVAFGLAIPNVLSQALLAYREVAGSAGALFGLGYYLLLSLGLAVAASLQDLGLLLGDAVCWHCAAVGSAADKTVMSFHVKHQLPIKR